MKPTPKTKAPTIYGRGDKERIIMGIQHLKESKELKRQGMRLGRDGLSQRVNELVFSFLKDNPEGNFREAIILAGKLHAIYLATDPQDYWREVAHRGYTKEFYDLIQYDIKEEPGT